MTGSMIRIALPHFVATMCVSVAVGADLNVDVTSQGDALVCVAPEATLVYEVNGVLSDTDNDGLAGVLFGLTFSGGPLEPADTPAVGPMMSFVHPEGLTNPGGFGGTLINGDLVQVGGLQNTINNLPEDVPFPVGEVALGIAHESVVMVTGMVTAPLEAGSYTLSVSDLLARVIRKDADGVPAWFTAEACMGTVVDLIVHVGGLLSDGDFDGDGVVDSSDFVDFQDCVTGPDMGPVECDCLPGDFDGDTDLDLLDFGAFQAAFGS